MKSYNRISGTVLTPIERTHVLDTAINQLRTDVLNVVNKKDKDMFFNSKRTEPIVFVLGERITFREGEATLLETYHSISKKIAEFIASKKGYQVAISGHTDNTPINTEKFPSNLNCPQPAPLMSQHHSSITVSPRHACPSKDSPNTGRCLIISLRKIVRPIAGWKFH